jgi:hypothetical protein
MVVDAAARAVDPLTTTTKRVKIDNTNGHLFFMVSSYIIDL